MNIGLISDTRTRHNKVESFSITVSSTALSKAIFSSLSRTAMQNASQSAIEQNTSYETTTRSQPVIDCHVAKISRRGEDRTAEANSSIAPQKRGRLPGINELVDFSPIRSGFSRRSQLFPPSPGNQSLSSLHNGMSSAIGAGRKKSFS